MCFGAEWLSSSLLLILSRSVEADTGVVQIGTRTFKALESHMTHFSYSPMGALRWKRDVTEYAEALRPAITSSPAVRSKFEELTGVINILLVAPESLPSLVESSLRLTHAQVLPYVKMREDYKTARVKGTSLAALFSAS